MKISYALNHFLPAAVLGALWSSPSLPKPLSGILPDFYKGEQTTFDVTDQIEDALELEAAAPLLLTPSTLLTSPGNPLTYTIAYASLTPASRWTSLRHNALMPIQSPLAFNRLYHYRFVEVPGSNRGGRYSLGISSLDAYGPQWAARGLFLGDEGNLASQGLLYSKFTNGHGVGDLVDWFLEVRPTAVDIFIAVNNQIFGHAFHLDFSPNTTLIHTLRPIVGFNERAVDTAVCMVAFEAVRIPPDPLYKNRASTISAGILGDWLLARPEVPVPVSLQVESIDDSRSTRLSLTVRNILTTQVDIDRRNGKVSKRGGVVSTRMGVSEDEQYIEKTFDNLLSHLKLVRSPSDDLLELVGLDGFIYHFVRNTTPIRVQTENPFIVM